MMRPAASLPAIALTVALPLFSAPAAAQSWALVDSESDLTFEVDQRGTTMRGRFTRFKADIDFDPDDLDPATARVTVDMASADVDNDQGNQILRGEDWFDVAAHPRSVFETTDIRRTDTGYEAKATLTIKGQTVPLTLPFRLTVEGDRAHMTGKTSLDRTKFDIGGGDADDMVGKTVTVSVDIMAERQ